MKVNPNVARFGAVVAIAVVGAWWLGLSIRAFALFGIFLACPLMMFFMMRGMQGDRTEPEQHLDDRQSPRDHPSQR